MEFIIVGIIALISVVGLKYIFDYNKKELKQIGEDKELDKLAKKNTSNG